jgi:peptidyl-prolyl cis-trans isomerase A (cyclophilin A)
MLAGMSASLLGFGFGLDPAASAETPERILVRVETELGTLLIAVFPRKAPVTVANFLAYVDAHHLDHASVYRIVTPSNQHPEPAAKISIVQWGMNLGTRPPPLPPIAHETTATTGLHHRHGTISMARLAPGTAASEFFICIGDQPELDFGGHRNPDGVGFAAFGEVIIGGAIVDAIYARAESDQMLRQPILVRSVVRV